MHFLLVRNQEEVFGQLATLLAALLDALSSDSERVVLQVGSFLGRGAVNFEISTYEGLCVVCGSGGGKG
jgi:hypothetical protein